MLLNIYETRPATRQGSRQLEAPIGIEGARIQDLYDATRHWTIGPSYLPSHGRQLGGIRVQLVDQKGFITFCNQRDMEVLVGSGRPGEWCRWAAETYVAPGDEKWVGLYCDEADVQDILYDHETQLREYSQYRPWLLPPGVRVPPVDIEFRVHAEAGYDVEERHVLVLDHDPETGYGPDTRLETLHQRWARSERRRIQWNRV